MMQIIALSTALTIILTHSLDLLASSAKNEISNRFCKSLFEMPTIDFSKVIVKGVGGRRYALSEMYQVKGPEPFLMYRGVSKHIKQISLDHRTADEVLWLTPNRDYAIEYAIGQYQIKHQHDIDKPTGVLFEYEVPPNHLFWTANKNELEGIPIDELSQYEYEAILPSFFNPKKFLKRVLHVDSYGKVLKEIKY